MERFIGSRFADPTCVAFVVAARASDAVVGGTCALNIRPMRSGLEMGATLHAKRVRGRTINLGCKGFLLGDAFEVTA